MKPAEAVRALKNFRQATPQAILRGARRGLRNMEALAKGKFMMRGAYAPSDASVARADPPNPPPGPLKIRSGRLIRTIRSEIKFDGTKVRGFLRAGSSDVRYARIHEVGGMAGAGHRSLIRPRPYFGPAIAEGAPAFRRFIREEIIKLAGATLRGLAKANFNAE